ncbi:pentapeptide repeat-containing protein [Mangrovibacterium lignilyticum]|uniref:pentapeptide repeat-containing protein n=1 Tax=Mangrovibacterium lignilyticum TaxID=2668052 RepID=UPI0013D1809F|nr:pentapeptide repeat-containing protein [Mangrovibacterium lignilyticum]
MSVNSKAYHPKGPSLLPLYELIKQKRESYNGAAEEVSVFINTPYYENRIITDQYDFLTQELVESFTALKCLFKCKLDFEGTDIVGQLRITDSFFEKEFTHYGATIEEDVKFNKTIFNDVVMFSGVTFEGTVDFYDAKFGQSVKFIGCTFNKYVSFENTVFGDKVEFVRCTFEDAADFRLTDSYRDKTEMPYYHPMNCSFKDTTFKKKVIFYHRHFPECTFENTKFEGLVDFYNTRFNAETRFYKTDFLETAVFSKAVFSAAVVFHYAKVAKNMILRETAFNGGVNMAYINFISDGFLELFGLNIDTKGFVSVSAPLNYDIDQNDDWKTVTHYQKRETYRILKHESLKQNNRIQALAYHALEMEAYRIELRDNGCKWYENDRFITGFNRLSNNYGLSWRRGLGWLFGISVLGFIVYWLLLSSRPIIPTLDTTLSDTFMSVGKVIGYYLQFTNPAHDIEFMEVYSGSWSYATDILVRLIVGLLIYQTIQAFRKYGRF